MIRKQINIGMFGFGNVGRGLYEVLQKAPSANAQLRKVVVKDQQKVRQIDPQLLSFDADDIIKSDVINTVVELIDNADEAFKIVELAMKAGKNVVSGNKKMVAENLEYLLHLQQQTGASLLYDASACGSIPIIRNLEEYYDNDLLISITGILNGSTNYIFTQMYKYGTSYKQALSEAQDKGFAERNPVFDVEGYDSMFKLIILALHGFGTIVSPDEIFFTGIDNISALDIRLAKEKGCKIKLIAKAFKTHDNHLSLLVMPAFVDAASYIFNVDDEFNGVVIQGDAYDEQLMFGKGAGGQPTGSAVLSDITALSYNYRYEYKKRKFFTPPSYTTDVPMKVYFRYQSPEVPDLLPLIKIEEQYVGAEYQYTVGWVNVRNLLEIKPVLRQYGVFCAFFVS